MSTADATQRRKRCFSAIPCGPNLVSQEDGSDTLSGPRFVGPTTSTDGGGHDG